jgi:hypothetical protein
VIDITEANSERLHTLVVIDDGGLAMRHGARAEFAAHGIVEGCALGVDGVLRHHSHRDMSLDALWETLRMP